MFRHRYAVALFFLYLLPTTVFGIGAKIPPSDPQALAYAGQAIAAISNGVSIRDITLTGNVTWNGVDNGTATLRALGIFESRMDLALSSGTLVEIRDSQTGSPEGKWIAPNGLSSRFTFENCWTDAGWFFPVLGSLAGGSNTVLSYVGEEEWNGVMTQHLRSYRAVTSKMPQPSPDQLSTMDFYLDATTFLPVSVTLNIHPDKQASVNIPVEVDFSEYQNLSGIVVPTRIQRRQQGNTLIDITLTSASFNTGLSLSIFAIN